MSDMVMLSQSQLGTDASDDNPLLNQSAKSHRHAYHSINYHYDTFKS